MPAQDSGQVEASGVGESHADRSGIQVDVWAPCRLHFGLFSFGHTGHRQFGGVGLMVDRAAVRLCLTPADHLMATGPLAERVLEFAKHWSRYYGMSSVPCCRIDVQSTAPQHRGLGVGTQLALSVATALNTWLQRPQPLAQELGQSVGRGLRSAVGTYGFANGGLIVERGKLPSDGIAPLDAQLDLPGDWRFVLIEANGSQGLSGHAEQRAFADLPPVPKETTSALTEEVRLHLLPAAAVGDFSAFSESVYRYGRLAGMCFASVQGGPYNGNAVTELIQRVRDIGVAGVGQSSWGPTVFAIVPSQQRAEWLSNHLRREYVNGELQVSVAAANQNGARVTTRGGASTL